MFHWVVSVTLGFRIQSDSSLIGSHTIHINSQFTSEQIYAKLFPLPVLSIIAVFLSTHMCR